MMLFMTSLLISAQAETILNGIQLNESFEEVAKKLNEISKNVDTISVESPRFPLAKTKEEHLVCTQLKTDNGIIS